jgi:hypothetical protein
LCINPVLALRDALARVLAGAGNLVGRTAENVGF